MGTSIWTKDELTVMIAEWKAAYRAAAAGRSYTIEGRSLTRYDLDDIRRQLDYLEKEQDKASGRGGPTFVQGRVRR